MKSWEVGLWGYRGGEKGKIMFARWYKFFLMKNRSDFGGVQEKENIIISPKSIWVTITLSTIRGKSQNLFERVRERERPVASSLRSEYTAVNCGSDIFRHFFPTFFLQNGANSKPPS